MGSVLRLNPPRGIFSWEGRTRTSSEARCSVSIPHGGFLVGKINGSSTGRRASGFKRLNPPRGIFSWEGVKAELDLAGFVSIPHGGFLVGKTIDSEVYANLATVSIPHGGFLVGKCVQPAKAKETNRLNPPRGIFSWEGANQHTRRLPMQVSIVSIPHGGFLVGKAPTNTQGDYQCKYLSSQSPTGDF